MTTDQKDRTPEELDDVAKVEAEPQADGDTNIDATEAELGLSDLEAELTAANDRFLRLAAEYDNYRRRTERERGESAARAQAQLAEQLMEPLDDLQRVAQFTEGAPGAEPLLEGVQMVERKLFRALEAAGMVMIDARGQPFDPNLHEALMTVEAESAEEDDTVGEVFQNGYQFKGILLRPARVQVKKYEG